MDTQVRIGKKTYIRNIGRDEYWLQEIIYAIPEKLGLNRIPSADAPLQHKPNYPVLPYRARYSRGVWTGIPAFR